MDVPARTPHAISPRRAAQRRRQRRPRARALSVGAPCWQIPSSLVPSWSAEMQRLLPLKKVKGYAPPEDLAAIARI